MQAIRRSFRKRFALGAAVCAALMGYALYAQYVQHLEPCPLCIFQRIAMIALGVVFLLGALIAPKSPGGRRAWGVLALLTALAGIVVAGRHVWIQSLPADQVPACGPGLNYMWQAFPLGSMLEKVLQGSGECAQVNWRFFGLTMPGWVLICFVVLAGWAVLAGFRKHR